MFPAVSSTLVYYLSYLHADHRRCLAQSLLYIKAVNGRLSRLCGREDMEFGIYKRTQIDGLREWLHGARAVADTSGGIVR
jgi:hypothetical protein